LDIPSSLSITHLFDIEVTRLSNGQLKKLLLLKSFSKGVPKLLLLDYPFEGLDYESREDLCQFIDFICVKYNIQVIIADNHHHLPSVVRQKLILHKFQIKGIEQFDATSTREIKIRPDVIKPRTIKENEVLRIENLHLSYGDREIFKDFNWTVCKGDRWVLIGRNGVGKTTLFSMIFADHPMAYTQKLYLFGRISDLNRPAT
jgi:molybdate transport system ATP-binding protein